MLLEYLPGADHLPSAGSMENVVACYLLPSLVVTSLFLVSPVLSCCVFDPFCVPAYGSELPGGELSLTEGSLEEEMT